ncbi:MAG TPA: hypothetical protein V6C72_06255, partial [Chroococcales cyanobacterium]
QAFVSSYFPTVREHMAMISAKLAAHPPARSDSKPAWQTALAATFVFLMLCVPARVYFWPGRPVSSLNFFDRSPWVFATFLIRQKTRSVSIAYQTADSAWHDYPVQGRMADPATDSDLLAMSQYIFREKPEAQALRVEVGLNLNDHWLQTKTFTAERTAQLHPTLVVRDEPLEIGAGLPVAGTAKAGPQASQ